MYRSRRILAGAGFLGLMVMPVVCHAATADDPGAFAALGTIYFSSVLDDAGIGSGGSGEPSTGDGGSGGAGSLTHRSSTGGNTTTPSGGSTPVLGNAAPGNSPGGSNDVDAPVLGTPIHGDAAPGNSPGGSDLYTEVFGDVVPLPGGGGGNSAHLPEAGSESDEFPAAPEGSPVGGYLPDEILSSQGGLVLPEVPSVASSVASSSSAQILQVPEPASLALFGAGLAGLGLMSRRWKTA